ncbi:MAG: hypothetical protein L6R39_004789 [Caloplaca ligustica]|nr:MAG: hypothetical protein L6R39_004789 [Caloplaca ligustica]
MAYVSSSPPPGFLSPTGSRTMSPTRDPSIHGTPHRSQDSSLDGSPLQSSTSQQVASEGYIQQYQSVLDHQRRAFDSERAMWNMERAGLVQKIATLEASLRQHQASTRGSLSASTKIPMTSSGSPRLGSFPGAYGPRHATQSSGNEFWRGAGGRSDARPTRTFSESATFTHTNLDRLPGIAENLPPAKSGGSLSESLKLATRGIGGPDSQKRYDGIIFKSTLTGSAEPTGTKSGATGSLSSSRESPRHLQLPTVHEVDTSTNEDNLTKDAGHTPLARTVPGLDGTTSAADSDLPTPTTEREQPPFEPRASVAKVPSERSDSYFPPPPDDGDHDPELQGQLGLKNDGSDNQFLSELDSKLAQAAGTPAPPSAAQAPANLIGASREDGEALHAVEPEPRLRIKRSMNFGSQLGGRFKPEP